jgi:hypothetical protein
MVEILPDLQPEGVRDADIDVIDLLDLALCSGFA